MHLNLNNTLGSTSKEEQRGDYKERLCNMGDDELYQETKLNILMSAYAWNHTNSHHHLRCDATYDAWKSRNKLSMYQKAHEEVVRNAGH